MCSCFKFSLGGVWCRNEKDRERTKKIRAGKKLVRNVFAVIIGDLFPFVCLSFLLNADRQKMVHFKENLCQHWKKATLGKEGARLEGAE